MALLCEINSVNSLVQAYLALLEASDQFLIVAAPQHPLIWENILRWAELHPGEGLCLSTNTIVSLGSYTSNFHCHLDA